MKWNDAARGARADLARRHRTSSAASAAAAATHSVNVKAKLAAERMRQSHASTQQTRIRRNGHLKVREEEERDDLNW